MDSCLHCTMFCPLNAPPMHPQQEQTCALSVIVAVFIWGGNVIELSRIQIDLRLIYFGLVLNDFKLDSAFRLGTRLVNNKRQ